MARYSLYIQSNLIKGITCKNIPANMHIYSYVFNNLTIPRNIMKSEFSGKMHSCILCPESLQIFTNFYAGVALTKWLLLYSTFSKKVQKGRNSLKNEWIGISCHSISTSAHRVLDTNKVSLNSMQRSKRSSAYEMFIYLQSFTFKKSCHYKKKHWQTDWSKTVYTSQHCCVGYNKTTNYNRASICIAIKYPWSLWLMAQWFKHYIQNWQFGEHNI